MSTPKQEGRPLLVVEVSGGVVQAVYADTPLRVVLVDWDNIQDGDTAIVYGHDALSDMPLETARQVLNT